MTKRYLLDTYILVWALFSPNKLPRRVRYLLEKEAGIYVSTTTLWEIAIKVSANKLDLGQIKIEELIEAIEDLGFIIVSPEPLTYIKYATLPPFHTDPFDKLLISQALFEGYILVTADSHIKKIAQTHNIPLFDRAHETT